MGNHYSKELARKNDRIKKIKQGFTTVEEVLRVTQEKR